MAYIRRDDKGLLSLEACIAVTIFIFLMLYMYSFFVVFEARNALGHAVLATANSMALDAYATSIHGDSDTAISILYKIYDNSNSNAFIDYSKWNENEDEFKETVITRFTAYLTGGNKGDVNNILGKYHIKGGIEGLDFSESYVDSDNLYLSVKYTIEYEFNVFHKDGLQMEQKACSKLWK